MFTELSSLNEIQFKLDKLPRNQQVLFAADCARSVLHHFEDKYPDDKRPRLAIELAESLKYDEKIANAAWFVADSAADYADVYADVYAADAAWAAAVYAAAANAAWSAAYAVTNAVWFDDVDWSIKAGQSWEFINNLYSHAYNPNPFPNNYKTPDVLNIAQSIIIERDFASSQILADALEDAGCTDEDLLNHLRNDTIGLSNWTLFNLRQD